MMAEKSNRTAKMKPVYFYGLSRKVKRNAYFLNDQTLLYLLGRVFVFHDLERNTQKYMKIPLSIKSFTNTAISPGKHLIALVGKHESDRPIITVYDIHKRKMIKSFGNPLMKCESKEFTNLAFSMDGHFLIVITGPPDRLMMNFQWGNGKLDSYVKATGKGPDVNINTIDISPYQKNKLILTGEGLFRMLQQSEQIWRQTGFHRGDKLPITSVCWLSKTLVLLGTFDGRLIILEQAELKAVYMVDNVMTISFTLDSRSRVHLSSNLVPEKFRYGDYQVRCLTRFSKGFAYSCEAGNVTVFEDVQPMVWNKKNVFSTGLTHPIHDAIRCISLSTSEKRLVCTSGRSEIYFSDIFISQNFEKEPYRKFCVLFNGYHKGQIATVATCQWRSWFLTVGSTDHTCRIWNYSTKKQILTKRLKGNVYSAAFHPHGSWCLIGFNQSLQAMLIKRHDMRTFYSIDIPECPLVEFCKSGHIFAAVNKFDIHLYSFYRMELISILTGHGSVITGLNYCMGDRMMQTCTMNGEIAKWNLESRKLSGMISSKDVICQSMGIMKNGTKSYLIDNDSAFKEMETNGMIKRAITFKNAQVSQFTLVHDLNVFLAGSQGSILTMQIPIQSIPTYKQYHFHSSPVKKIVEADNGRVIISLDKTGVIGVWKIKYSYNVNDISLHYSPRFSYGVINSIDWLIKEFIVNEQQKRLDEMSSEHEYTLLTLKKSQDDALRALLTTWRQRVVDYENSYQHTITRHNLEASKLKSAMDSMILYYEDELVKQSKNYEARLNTEIKEAEKIKTRLDNILFMGKGLIKDIEAAGLKILKTNEYFCKLKLQKEINVLLETEKSLFYSNKSGEEDIIEQARMYNLELMKQKETKKEEIVLIGEEIEKLSTENHDLKEKSSAMDCELNLNLANIHQLTVQKLELRKMVDELTVNAENTQNELKNKSESLLKKDILIVEEMRKRDRYFKERLVRDTEIRKLKKDLETMETHRASWKQLSVWLKSEIESANRNLSKLGVLSRKKTVTRVKRKTPPVQEESNEPRPVPPKKPVPKVQTTTVPENKVTKRSDHPTLVIQPKHGRLATSRNIHFHNMLIELRKMRSHLLQCNQEKTALQRIIGTNTLMKVDPEDLTTKISELESILEVMVQEIKFLNQQIHVNHIPELKKRIQNTLKEKKWAIQQHENSDLVTLRKLLKIQSNESSKPCYIDIN